MNFTCSMFQVCGLSLSFCSFVFNCIYFSASKRINYFQSNDKEMKRRRLKIKSLTSSSHNFFFFFFFFAYQSTGKALWLLPLHRASPSPLERRERREENNSTFQLKSTEASWLPVGVFVFGFRFALQSGVYCCCLSCFCSCCLFVLPKHFSHF